MRDKNAVGAECGGKKNVKKDCVEEGCRPTEPQKSSPPRGRGGVGRGAWGCLSIAGTRGGGWHLTKRNLAGGWRPKEKEKNEHISTTEKNQQTKSVCHQEVLSLFFSPSEMSTI